MAIGENHSVTVSVERNYEARGIDIGVRLRLDDHLLAQAKVSDAEMAHLRAEIERYMQDGLDRIQRQLFDRMFTEMRREHAMPAAQAMADKIDQDILNQILQS